MEQNSNVNTTTASSKPKISLVVLPWKKLQRDNTEYLTISEKDLPIGNDFSNIKSSIWSRKSKSTKIFFEAYPAEKNKNEEDFGYIKYATTYDNTHILCYPSRYLEALYPSIPVEQLKTLDNQTISVFEGTPHSHIPLKLPAGFLAQVETIPATQPTLTNVSTDNSTSQFILSFKQISYEQKKANTTPKRKRTPVIDLPWEKMNFNNLPYYIAEDPSATKVRHTIKEKEKTYKSLTQKDSIFRQFPSSYTVILEEKTYILFPVDYLHYLYPKLQNRNFADFSGDHTLFTTTYTTKLKLPIPLSPTKDSPTPSGKREEPSQTDPEANRVKHRFETSTTQTSRERAPSEPSVTKNNQEIEWKWVKPQPKLSATDNSPQKEIEWKWVEPGKHQQPTQDKQPEGNPHPSKKPKTVSLEKQPINKSKSGLL